MKAKVKVLCAIGALVLLGGLLANADEFSGTLYYTKFAGTPNVWKVDYNYNDATQVLTMSNNTSIASLGGADGIIFDGSGRLLVGGQNPIVYRMDANGANLASVSSGGSGAFHLALSPDAQTVYTSSFGGPLSAVPLNPLTAGTLHTVTGGDTGLTQIAFAPNGNVFYVNGQPNGGGNVGTITNVGGAGNVVTTRLFSSVTSAHGLIYDSFTGKMTLFGAGAVGTFSTTGAGVVTQRTGINADFDQGSVDGLGHAFIAGNGQLTFIDYKASGDITSAANVVRIVSGFANIDDLAPLSGLGSAAIPEPGSVGLLLTAIGGVFYGLRRRSLQKGAAQ